jgi:hypothetical protein
MGTSMKKIFIALLVGALGAGICRILRADDSTSPGPGPDNGQAIALYLWNIEHAAEIAKDPDMAGVQAVIQADQFLKTSQQPQVEIDWFTKAMYNTRNPAVKRQIQLTLFNLYKQVGQNDKALDQLQQLMMEE